MRLRITLILLTLIFVGDAADAGWRKRRRLRRRRKPVPTQPAPAPTPAPEPEPLPPNISVVPDGTYVGVLGGRLIQFTATPMAFLTLYGDLPNSDPEISHAYVSGNYSNYISHMGIVFIYIAHDGSIHHSETFSGTYSIQSDGTLIFTGAHGTAVFTRIG